MATRPFYLPKSWQFHFPFSSQFIEMVQVSNILKAFMLAVVLTAVAAASAQEVSLALAPSPDAGAGFSVQVYGVLIGTSLLVSLFASLRN